MFINRRTENENVTQVILFTHKKFIYCKKMDELQNILSKENQGSEVKTQNVQCKKLPSNFYIFMWHLV